jgi:hypothetical protein
VFLAAISLWVSSCAVALGPGYSIENQEIRVQFLPGPDPRIRVDSDYRLRNTGNQPLASLELRLPGRSFHLAAAKATWDGSSIAQQSSLLNPRNTLLALPKTWSQNEGHNLHLSAEFQNPVAGVPGFSFAPDAFFLPSEGWAPELLPSEGLFSTGGVPPHPWRLLVHVPDGFLVHTSGRATRTSRNAREITVQAVQHSEDRYPFVVAGRYRETSLDAGSGNKVFLWSRAREDSALLRKSRDALALAIQAYDATFGARSQKNQPLWIVECPDPAGCFRTTESSYAHLLSAEPGAVSSELASLDTLMIDFSGRPPKLAAAAPALAASWLGYGQNPGFYEQQPPLSAFPAFASALGQEAIEGPSSRSETIRRALRVIPKSAVARQPEGETVLRAKSFLFFYALQERFGRDAFRHAIDHMLAARQGRGFNLNDLIAAFEQETHQNVAEFVRLWMKRPGVPDDFRSRYEDASASIASTPKETMP